MPVVKRLILHTPPVHLQQNQRFTLSHVRHFRRYTFLLRLIFSHHPRRICRHLVTLSRLLGRRQMFFDCLHPRLLICRLVGSPYRQALSRTLHLLSSAADTTDSRVKLTEVSRSSSFNLKAISTKVQVDHPTFKRKLG